jgi:hypothetical protein
MDGAPWDDVDWEQVLKRHSERGTAAQVQMVDERRGRSLAVQRLLSELVGPEFNGPVGKIYLLQRAEDEFAAIQRLLPGPNALPSERQEVEDELSQIRNRQVDLAEDIDAAIGADELAKIKLLQALLESDPAGGR